MKNTMSYTYLDATFKIFLALLVEVGKQYFFSSDKTN